MEITSQEFDLSNQSFWAAVTFERIQKSLNPNLVLINLSTNHVNYESAELLSNLMIESKTLLYLNLTETHLVRRSSDIIFEALGDSSILEFYADDNIFYDESCQKLGESLQKNPPLQLLSLCGCDISSKGCISIVKGISKDSKITDLRLESNSLFDYGATEVANIIPASNLTLLSIADNEIWSEGTNNIIKAVRGSTITALDLSYNVVDLKNLTSLLVDFDNIQAISISGCKVSEKDFPTFISSLPKTKLRTLILESLNFQPIPISWPEVPDTLWTTYFDIFLSSLSEFQTIEDLRLGFMNLDQLYKVKSTLERLRQEPLTISFKDFGRTNDCWIYHFPESTYESPDTIMQWRDSITVHNAFFIGHIINHTTASNNRQIEILNLSQCQIDDEILSKIINSIDGHNLKSIDLSDNNGITDESVEYLLQYISQSQLESINLYETKITDSGYDRIFSLPLLPLKNISLSFETHQLNEDQHHQFFSSIASLLRTQECVLEDLRMTGYITPVDAKEIVESLHENTSLRHLEIDSLHCEKYENPDPVIDPNIQSLYDDFTEALADAVMGEGTSCRLCSLVYPLLTEVYVFSERGMKIFADIEDKLKENMEMYGKDNE